MPDAPVKTSITQKIIALTVHTFTTLGAVLAFWSLVLIVRGELQNSLYVMALAVIVDSLDGTLARLADVTIHAPFIDGSLMDNISDYLNWVFIPLFWAFTFLDLSIMVIFFVLITSLFGFSNTSAKTEDHFFLGFPSYWNFVVFYLYLIDASAWVNSAVMILLALMILVPIKFIYPSRTKLFRKSTIILSVPYAAIVFYMLIYLHDTPPWLILASFYYPVYYVAVSVIADRRNKM